MLFSVLTVRVSSKSSLRVFGQNDDELMFGGNKF